MEQGAEAGKALANIVDTRGADLSEERAHLLRALAVEWSDQDVDEGLRTQAPRLAQTLLLHFPERFNELAQSWAVSLLDGLCDECVIWLSTRFADFEQEGRTQVANALRGITEGELTGRMTSAHRLFFETLDNRGQETEEVRSHLNYLLDHMANILPSQTPAQNASLSVQVENAQEFLMGVLPSLVPLLGRADEENVVRMIDRIFGNAINVADTPDLFGTLHAEMAGHWPDPDTNSYDAAAVFDTAERVCSEHPDAESNPAVLRSMLSLSSVGGILDEDYYRRLAGIAATIWPYNPELTVEYVLQIDASPEPGSTAGIVQDLDLSGEASELRQEQLRGMWEHWARRMSEEEQVQTTLSLLGVETASPEQDGDAALRWWIAAMPLRQTVVHQLIQNERVTDDDRARIWRQICSDASIMGKEFFTETLPDILAWEDSERTWKAVIDCQTEVSDLFGSQTQKNALGRALVKAFQDCPSGPTRGEILRWINTLQATHELRQLNEGELSEEDEEQLSATFGKRWRRK